MLGAHRGPVKREQSAALEDAINDGVGQVVIVQDAAPRRECLVGREDHRALLAMAIIDHVKEHVRGIRAVGKIADLVDDQKIGFDVRRERVDQTSGAEGG